MGENSLFTNGLAEISRKEIKGVGHTEECATFFKGTLLGRVLMGGGRVHISPDNGCV